MRSNNMPLFSTGRTFNPYASDTPEAKRRRLNAVGEFAEALGFPEIDGALHEAARIVDKTGDQFVPPSSRGLLSSTPASSSRKTMSRRHYRRFHRRRRKTFRAKVGSALLKFAERKRLVDSIAQATFTAGDGVSRVLYIANPVANLTQGTDGNDIVGNSFWIERMWLRGRISLDQTTNSLRVRILLIKSRQFADLPPGWTTYGNTTTISTNPAQTAADLENNIRIFETTDAEEAGQPSAPFVGNPSGIDIIDTDLVHVVGGREFFLSQQHLLNFQNVSISIPVNKKFKIYSEIGATPVDQLRTHDGYNYYWIMQVFSNSNANNILAAQDILGTFDIITYHKEV